MAIHMGYMGHCKIDSTLVKITSSSINPVQNIEAPELVAGDWNKKAWVEAKIETGGNVAGPLAENSADVWGYAWDRDQTVGDKMLHADFVVEIAYYKGGGRTFNGCQIGMYELSVQAGEVAQFTIDFMGTTSAVYTGDIDISEVTCEKLITWDICSFDIDNFAADTEMQQFTYTLNNNLQRQYKLNQSVAFGLYPAEILAGIRSIEGNLSFYADSPPDTMFPVAPAGPPFFGADHWDDYVAANTTAVTVTAGTGATAISIVGNMVFGRAQASAQTGPVIYTVNFVGVCSQTE